MEAIIADAVGRAQPDLDAASRLALVSQVRKALESGTGGTGHAGAGGSDGGEVEGDGCDSGDSLGPPIILLSRVNTFGAMRSGGEVIPQPIVNTIYAGLFVPLSLLTSEAIHRQNFSVDTYPTTTVTTGGHRLAVIDVEKLPREDELTRDQFTDALRRLGHAYQAANMPIPVIQDLFGYADRLQNDMRFRDDSLWPAVLQFDREARLAWSKPAGGRFYLNSEDVFTELDKAFVQWQSASYARLMHRVDESMQFRRANPPSQDRGRASHGDHRRRSPSPRRRSRSPFRTSSRANLPRACCIICGSDQHSGRLCRARTSACELQGNILKLSGTKDVLCFGFNIRAGCSSSNSSDHPKHWCSICAKPGHGAQDCRSHR